VIKSLLVSFSPLLIAEWRLPPPLHSYYEYSFSCLSNKVALIQPELGSGRGEEPFEERNALSFDLPGSNGDPPKVADLSHL